MEPEPDEPDEPQEPQAHDEETPDHRLTMYLDDHLAGSSGAVRLAERLRDRDPAGELGRVLDELIAEIEQDRATLRRIMDLMGATPSTVKRTGAVAAELLGSLRHRLPVLGAGSSKVALLEDVEVLSLGIEGKRLLWAALGAAASKDERLREFDFDDLQQRAHAQRYRLEPFRLRLATESI